MKFLAEADQVLAEKIAESDLVGRRFTHQLIVTVIDGEDAKRFRMMQ